MAELAPIYLSYNDVCNYLHNQWDPLIKAIENALKSFSCGRVVQPVRAAVSVKQHNGLLLAMPAYNSEEDTLATKVVTMFPENRNKCLPSIQAVVLLYSASTGSLKAILDGITITNMRTAAASAVATKYLMKDDSRILAILGAGMQARSNFQALTYLHKFEKIRIWNIHKETAESFVAEIQNNGFPVECCSTVEEAVKDADVIVTVTMSQTPILQKQWVKPGAHINAVGAPSPTWQEIAEDLMQSAIVYVDSLEAAMVESGDIIKSGVSVFAEMGQVISGEKVAMREQTTIFKSLGMAVEDVVAAELVFKRYEEIKKQTKS